MGGWNKPSEAPKVAPKKAPNAMRGIVAGLVTVCALGGLCLWMFSGGDDAPKAKPDRERGRIREVAAAKTVKPTGLPSSRVEKEAEVESDERVASETNAKPNGIALPEDLVKSIVRSNKVFKTSVEHALSLILRTEPGMMPMPIPKMDEEEKNELAAALVSRCERKDSDSEEIAEVKDAVDNAKKEMVRFIKDGGDPNDFLQYYLKELKRAYSRRQEAVRQIQDASEDNPEIAEDFREKVNEMLDQEGIKRISKKDIE